MATTTSRCSSSGLTAESGGRGVVYRINADQADVIRRIFALCAAGKGLTRIAKTLNAEHVPPPRAGRHGWAPTAIREILYARSIAVS